MSVLSWLTAFHSEVRGLSEYSTAGKPDVLVNLESMTKLPCVIVNPIGGIEEAQVPGEQITQHFELLMRWNKTQGKEFLKHTDATAEGSLLRAIKEIEEVGGKSLGWDTEFFQGVLEGEESVKRNLLEYATKLVVNFAKEEVEENDDGD